MLWFFRDFLDGFMYFLYLVFCIIAFFYVLGVIGDRKRKMIEGKLREKKKYDIESGREAMIAAMETKQVLEVDDTQDKFVNDPNAEQDQNVTLKSAVDSNSNASELANEDKEKVPSVMVLNSGDSSSQGGDSSSSDSLDSTNENAPLVINTSGIEK